jgi:hypothetical protein
MAGSTNVHYKPDRVQSPNYGRPDKEQEQRCRNRAGNGRPLYQPFRIMIVPCEPRTIPSYCAGHIFLGCDQATYKSQRNGSRKHQPASGRLELRKVCIASVLIVAVDQTQGFVWMVRRRRYPALIYGQEANERHKAIAHQNSCDDVCRSFRFGYMHCAHQGSIAPTTWLWERAHKSCYRFSSRIAASSPPSVSGYMRSESTCWISPIEGVYSQCFSATGLSHTTCS